MTAATTKTTAAGAAKPAAKKAAKPAESVFKSVEDYTAAAREQFEKAFGDFSGNAEELRDQFETLSGAVNEGFNRTREHVTDVSSEIAEAAREEVADAVQFANDLTKAKSLTDALEIQRDYWTNLFEARVERTKEITERSINLARKNAEPFAEAKAPSFFADSKAFENFFRFPAKA